MYLYILVPLFVIIVGLYFIVYKKNRIPIMCYGCETPQGLSKILFKCIIETDEESTMCQTQKGLENLGDKYDEGKAIATAVFNQLTKGIPNTIKDELSKITTKVNEFISYIKEKIINFKNDFFKFFEKAFESVKNIVIRNADDLYKMVIKPITDFIEKQLIDPFQKLAKSLYSFISVLFTNIEDAISKFTGFTADFANKIINDLKSLPQKIGETFDKILGETFRNVINDIVSPLRNIFGSLGWILKPIINPIISLAEKIVSGLVNAIDKNLITPIKTKIMDKLAFVPNYIKNKYNQMEEKLISIIKTVTDPINNLIEYIITTGSAFVTSFTYFINNILSFEKLKEILEKISKKVQLTVEEAKNAIFSNIIDPILKVYNDVKDSVANFFGKIQKNITDLYKFVMIKVQVVFDKISEFLIEFSTFIFKNIGYISYIYFARLIDKLIPLDVPITVKLNLVLLIFIIIFILILKGIIGSFTQSSGIIVTLLLLLVPMYFGFRQSHKESKDAQKIKEETPIISQEIQVMKVEDDLKNREDVLIERDKLNNYN